MRIKGNKEAELATDMLGMTMRKLSHTDYYLTIRRDRNSGQREWENSTSKPHIKEWESYHNSCRK